MNRGTVILLALAILLAHTFAIHQTPDGEFAAPYEQAHVAYRLGRNIVFEGSAQWNPGGPAVESYPSPLWVLACAAAARLYVSPFLVSQGLGLVAALLCAITLAQFSPKRTSGLIAPVLLATSGSVAAAAMSGTEATLAMLLITAAFLAFERGWGTMLALALGLLVLTRPEGGAVLALLLLFEASWRPRGEHARRPTRLGAYVVPGLVALAAVFGRRWLTGQWLSPFAAPFFAFEPERWRLGGEYFLSFALSSGYGLLFLVLAFSVAAGRVSAMGARALSVAGLYFALVILSGGDELPFWNALVPVLPLFFLGVQDCLREWMDERESLAKVVWPVLLASVVAALSVSKIPGDLGPLRLESLLTRWQTPREALAKAYPRPLGRLGLLEEVRMVENLRRLGVFLRQRVGADAVILSACSGAIGYLSRKEVRDLSGRVWPPPGQALPLSWRGPPRVDVVAALRQGVDYIVPQFGPLDETDEPDEFWRNWLERYDVVGATSEREREVLQALEAFTLVSVPVPAGSRGTLETLEPSEHPFPLLQRKESESPLIPRIEILKQNGALRVLVRHEGPQQVVDLCVRATGAGINSFLAPTGQWLPSVERDARTSLLLFQTGSRPVQLVQAHIPGELAGARITAWLHNPGMSPSAALALVGTPTTLQLP